MFPCLGILLAISPQFSPDDPSLVVRHTTEAKSFTESCPLGNGRLGAMVFGGVQHDKLVLNESTMWSGSPQDADRADASKALPEIRRLLLAGDNAGAQRLLQSSFVCKGKGSGFGAGKDVPYGCYQLLADLNLDFPQSDYAGYTRTLDLDRAIATTSFQSRCVSFKREAFASAPDQVVVYRVTASKPGMISFRARLNRPEHATLAAAGREVSIHGVLASGKAGFDGVAYEGRLAVRTVGGIVTADKSELVVSGADSATLFFAAGTSMFDPGFRRGVEHHLAHALAKGYRKVKADHIADYRRFFRRVTLHLPEGPNSHMPTLDRLVAQGKGVDDPALAALLFNFGRYLLISSSRPDSPLPANLQGLWAEEIQTPWNGDFHLDINVQMNYWPAEVTNLSDCTRPLRKFISRLVPNGRKTAKSYYGAGGWVAHVITNPWLFTSPGEGADWGSTCTSGAWLCEHLWEHFAFTGDRSALAHDYPVMKEAAEFFLDSLVEEPVHRWLVTAPSNSPENAFIGPGGEHLNTCMGPTMDQEILRELFSNVIQAATVLGRDSEFLKRVASARSRLAPLQIGSRGQLMEWLSDYQEAEPHHRHVSHLYALYPSEEISPGSTPKFAEAARRTLELRGDDGTGWSLAWKACFWARLEDGDHAWKIIRRLLRPIGNVGYNYVDGGGTYPNLFGGHPPFQIDSNFGVTAAIAEMLVQSQGGEIKLLPALPKAWASNGSISGIRLRGGGVVDFRWKDGRVTWKRVRLEKGAESGFRNLP